MEQGTLITLLVLFLSPVIGIILSTTSLLNIGKKDLSELFEKIKKYIQKRKVENLSKIIFPESIGIQKNEEGVAGNSDALKNLSKEIDSVSCLEKSLSTCKRYSEFLFYSLFVIIFLGVLYFILSFAKLNITILDKYSVAVNIITVAYVFFGIFILIDKKKKLEALYEKEYDI